MRLVPMKFKGVSWRHNPREIKFECEKSVNELKAPFEKSYIQNMGRKNMIISGTGELYGSDCMQQFNELLALFKEGGCGVLSIPHMPGIFAVFESIKICGEPKPDILEYSFVFREVMEKKSALPPTVHTVKSGETLWDIAYCYDIPIDVLVKLNPNVRRPDEIDEGTEVVLC